MEVKNKPVTLEDLKELKEWMEGVAEVYKDITNTLTWNDATFLPPHTELNYTEPISGDTYDNTAGATNVKHAKIDVSAGETYKIMAWVYERGYNYTTRRGDGWTNTVTQAIIPWVLKNANGDTIDYEPMTTAGATDPHYREYDVVIPASAKYMYVFDFAGRIERTAGEVIVKKAQ